MIRFVHWLRIRSSLWTIIWTRSSRGLKIRKFHFFNFESSEKNFTQTDRNNDRSKRGFRCKSDNFWSRDRVGVTWQSGIMWRRSGSCDLGRDQILNSWTFMKYKHLVFLFEKDVNQSYEHLYEFQSSETQFMNAVQILKHPKIISLAISSTIND